MSLYNIKSSIDGFIITKFDDDLNVESSYEYHTMSNGPDVCHCPAGQRPTCRHRQMFPMLQLRVDSPWMLDFDTRQWVDPTGEAATGPQGSPSQGSPSQGSQSAEADDLPLREVQEESHTYEQVTKLPEDVIVVELNDPAAMHNAIAKGIGEPIIKYELPHQFRRRM